MCESFLVGVHCSENKDSSNAHTNWHWQSTGSLVVGTKPRVESYKHKVINKKTTSRPLKLLINKPCVVLLWADPHAAAPPSLDCAWHCLLKKEKAWSRSEIITWSRRGMGGNSKVPCPPDLKYPVSSLPPCSVTYQQKHEHQLHMTVG